MGKVTVIIPVYNGEQTIVNCVQSVLLNRQQFCEFIIIDDASTDKTPELLKQFEQAEIQVIRNTAHLGAASSRNLGLESATADFVFFTDADCIVDPDWIRSGLEMLEQPGVAGVEGCILYGNAKPTYMHKIPCNPFYHQRMCEIVNQPGQDFSAANIAFNRKAVRQINGFNARDFRKGEKIQTWVGA